MNVSSCAYDKERRTLIDDNGQPFEASNIEQFMTYLRLNPAYMIDLCTRTVGIGETLKSMIGWDTAQEKFDEAVEKKDYKFMYTVHLFLETISEYFSIIRNDSSMAKLMYEQDETGSYFRVKKNVLDTLGPDKLVICSEGLSGSKYDEYRSGKADSDQLSVMEIQCCKTLCTYNIISCSRFIQCMTSKREFNAGVSKFKKAFQKALSNLDGEEAAKKIENVSSVSESVSGNTNGGISGDHVSQVEEKKAETHSNNEYTKAVMTGVVLQFARQTEDGENRIRVFSSEDSLIETAGHCKQYVDFLMGKVRSAVDKLVSAYEEVDSNSETVDEAVDKLIENHPFDINSMLMDVTNSVQEVLVITRGREDIYQELKDHFIMSNKNIHGKLSKAFKEKADFEDENSSDIYLGIVSKPVDKFDTLINPWLSRDEKKGLVDGAEQAAKMQTLAIIRMSNAIKSDGYALDTVCTIN